MNQQRYTHGQMRSEISQLEEELGVSRSDPDETIGDEVRRLITAEKGSQADQARKTLGWSLVLFGLFGVTVLFFAIVVIGAAVGALF